MTQDEIYAEWQKLCEEHDAALDAYFKAFAIVNKKFQAIGIRASNVNPSDDELAEFEMTHDAWEDVKRRMVEFMKANP